ncbi:MAG: hypothetical protein U1D31_02215 [Patescibacteria group bacterium]|nr:hypothetical protein [bacterium]MDZ4240916.1 hypothetical protein [Patescibacteria group bacterium]
MSSETKKLLEKFAANANWRMPGCSKDMERFWDFVISAYRHGEHNISLDEFLGTLDTNAKSKEIPDESKFSEKKKKVSYKMFMFSTYENGIELLRKFEERQKPKTK